MLIGVPARIPPPAETPVEVAVSGRTSTIKSIVIVNVGQELPKTFSNQNHTNTPGFEWWVSRHYALKTDLPKEMAEFYLGLLEMTYPHYVELFGREPAGIAEKRMTVVYGASFPTLKAAMDADGVGFPPGSGGVTYAGINTAYQYAMYDTSHEWDHRRYILLHECTHLFQSCLNGSCSNTPHWYFEGVADRLGSHVYDAATKTLTVNVLDKAGPCYAPQEGIQALESHPDWTLEMIAKSDSLDYTRGAGLLLCAFFNATPDRAQKFDQWRDAMFAQQGKYDELMEKIFGPWAPLNAGFRDWVKAHSPLTFSSPHWRQWSQDGDTLWAFRSKPGDTKLWSILNVFLPPGAVPDATPWRMDSPVGPRSPLVGRVRRGVAEPSVGCVVDLSKGPGAGCAGFALGVVWEQAPNVDVTQPDLLPSCLRILLEGDGSLVIAGADLGMEDRRLPLPEPVRKAMAAGGHRAGITATIAGQELRVVVKVRDPGSWWYRKFAASVPLTEVQRKRLLTQPMALLAQGGYHGVTPCFDPGRASMEQE